MTITITQLFQLYYLIYNQICTATVWLHFIYGRLSYKNTYQPT